MVKNLPVKAGESEVKVKAAQSCLTLCDSMDYTDHGILQARVLEWIKPGLLHCRWILYQLSHKGSPSMQETWVQSLGQEDPPEKEMAAHSSILAWEIPWTEVPGRVQSTGSQKSRT